MASDSGNDRGVDNPAATEGKTTYITRADYVCYELENNYYF